MTYPGIFKKYYGDLSGRDWLRRVLPEDRQAFVTIGQIEGDHGRVGGVARAKTAARDSRGRFATASGMNKLTGVDPRKGTREDRDLWD